MKTARIAVLASGNGSDLQSILDAIAGGLIQRAKVVAVVSDNADAKALARGKAAGAESFHVAPVAKNEGGREEHERRILSAFAEAGGVDLVVLAGYMRLLSPAFVDRFAGRLINVHPALLPAFPGRDGPGDAVRYGVRIAGCSTHFVDHGVDSGPLILQAALAVRPGEDRDALHARILRLEHQILPRTVDLFVQGRLRLEGRRVVIKPGDSWAARVERVPDALYPDGF